ncbi:MAG: PAS domain S-box protein [Leptothrix sp. (in: b-proteobacteria)]
MAIHSRIRWLVIICLLPGWLLAAVVSYVTYDRALLDLKEHGLELARDLRRDTEHGLSSSKTTLRILAAATEIDDDFAALQRVSLSLPLGSPLPSPGHLAHGEAPGIAGIDSTHLAQLIDEHARPTHWAISILDRQGIVVACSDGAERMTGQLAAPELLRHIKARPEGMIELPASTGATMITAFSRSEALDWTVVTERTRATLMAGLDRAVGAYAVLASALLLLSLWLAGVIGRRWIARPVEALITPALAIGQGETVRVPHLHLKEIDAVGQALQQAQQLLFQRALAREQAEQLEQATRLTAQVAEAELLRSEQRFHLAMDVGSTVAFTLDRDFRYTWAHSCQAGFDEQFLLGKTMFDVYDEETAKMLTALYRQVIETGTGLRREVTVRSRIKLIEQHYEVIIQPLQATDSAVIGVVCAAIDISKRKLAEESMLRLAAIVAYSQDGILSQDLNGVVSSWNIGAEKIFGYAARDIVGQPFATLIPPAHLDEEQYLLAKIRADITIESYETEWFRQDGSTVAVAVTASPIKNADGQITGASSIVRDISERKRFTEALQLAKIEAEQANQAKSRFMAAASHDLRQPLSALTMYVGTLKHKLPKQEPLSQRIKDCVDNLNTMLSNLLDLSKLDAGAVQPELSEFSMAEVLESIHSIFTPQAQAKGMVLRVRGSDALICSDAVLFKRIIGNFVSNAIRYTERGGVLIGCRRRAGKYWVEVWDTGIGFPENRVTDIFAEFVQIKNTASNPDNGHGLGLAIVAKTAAVLGLQIRVRSWPGRGSMFAVELPLAKPMPVSIG